MFILTLRPDSALILAAKYGNPMEIGWTNDEGGLVYYKA
jgi:hypothetical protein